MDLKLRFDHFYRFTVGMIEGTMTVAPINNNDIATNDRRNFFRGDFTNVRPEVFVEVDGNKVYDFIVAGAPSFYLISDKVVRALRENSITGWGSYPVTIHTESMGVINNYHALYITGKALKADRTLAEKIEVVLSNKKKKIKDKGFYFPLDSWDGTDIFYHINTFGVTVTQRVKNLFESLNITNVKFEKCTEYIWA